MPINVSELINDIDFVQSFTVHRLSGTWVSGNFVTTNQDIAMSGSIQPLNSREISQLPEGDRVTGSIKIHTLDELYPTKLNQNNRDLGYAADEITWRNERYKIVQTQDYRDYGYHRAIAVRKLGA